MSVHFPCLYWVGRWACLPSVQPSSCSWWSGNECVAIATPGLGAPDMTHLHLHAYYPDYPYKVKLHFWNKLIAHLQHEKVWWTCIPILYSLLIHKKGTILKHKGHAPNCAVKTAPVFCIHLFMLCLLLLVSWVWSPPTSSVTNVAGWSCKKLMGFLSLAGWLATARARPSPWLGQARWQCNC